MPTNKSDTRITRSDAMRLYNDHLKMVRLIASRISKLSNLPYKDVQAEAEDILAYTVSNWNNGYDASKSKPSTWIYNKVYHGLLTFQNREFNKPKALPEKLYHKQSWVNRLISEVSEDAKTIVNTLLSYPSDLASDLSGAIKCTRGEPVKIRESMKIYMAKQGWSNDRVEQAWNEIRMAI